MSRYLCIAKLDEKTGDIMNTEEMHNHKPVMSTQVHIEKWSDVVLQVILIGGTPFVCDQNGLPLIGQKDIGIQSVAGKTTTFTATFRQFAK